MTGNIPKDEQCFFDTCHNRGSERIIFHRQNVLVCKTHAQRYGYSNEQGSKRAR